MNQVRTKAAVLNRHSELESMKCTLDAVMSTAFAGEEILWN